MDIARDLLGAFHALCLGAVVVSTLLVIARSTNRAVEES